MASELIWKKKWDVALDDSNPPLYRWFVGGITNITVNALDRHPVNRPAFIWVSSKGKIETYHYGDVLSRVNTYACMLKNLGVGRGDRAIIYMPMVPETAFILLAVARIGAVHNVVFSGFGAHALAERIRDSGSKLLIAADYMIRRGRVIDLLSNAREALRRVDGVQLLLYSREKRKFEAVATACKAEPEWVESAEPLFILYTSGTMVNLRAYTTDTGSTWSGHMPTPSGYLGLSEGYNFLHGRYRLDQRPFLRPLWAIAKRGDRVVIRRGARLSTSRRLVGDN